MYTLVSKKPEFQKAIDHLKQELGSIRTGRANTALVENIMVEAYGQPMNVKSLASITIPDAKSIVVDPWDKGVLKDLEKGIRAAGAGFSVVNEGQFLRCVIAPLTEETRKELVKILGQKLEEARGVVRRVREDAKAELVKEEESGRIREDDRYKMQDELDKLVAETNVKMKTMADEKEKEIMTV